MNGAHDMGGAHGAGPVAYEIDEPVFHSEWESRVLAMVLAMGAWGRWNIDMGRFARENVPPVDYLSRSYYETWLHGIETLLVEKGFLTPEEIAAARGGAHAEKVADPALTADMVTPVTARGSSARVDVDVVAKFNVGDRVRVINRHPRGHTRAPRYVRGRAGEIFRDHGVFVFPDTHAVDATQKPQHVYAVRFAATELWGAEVSQRDSVMVDLWDDYLEPAS